jgi:hypothetical protein
MLQLNVDLVGQLTFLFLAIKKEMSDKKTSKKAAQNKKKKIAGTVMTAQKTILAAQRPFFLSLAIVVLVISCDVENIVDQPSYNKYVIWSCLSFDILFIRISSKMKEKYVE